MGFYIAPGKFGKPQSLIWGGKKKKDQNTSENNTQPNVVYFWKT